MYDKVIRVLLVEANEDDYVVARDLLAEPEGCAYEVTWVATSQEALEALGQKAHDICLVDHRLSGDAGLDLLRAVRERGCRVPMILLSGTADRQLDHMAMKAGAADYLVKDGLTQALLERSICHAIERGRELEALRESEERYRRLVELSPDVVALHNEEKFFYINPSGVKLLGAETAEDITGVSVLDLVHPDYKQVVEARIRRAMTQGVACPPEEQKIIRRDGKVLDIDVTAIPTTHAGRPAVQVFIRDITERKQTEEALAERERLLRTIIETEPECVKLLDNDGQLLDMNRAGLQMIEADSFEQVAGKSVYPLIASEYREAFISFTEQVARGHSGRLEFELIGIRGTRRVMETNAAPLRNQSHEVFGQVAVTRDITERKRGEEALREANRHALREYERLLERLSKLAEQFGAARDLPTVYRTLRDFTLASIPCDALVFCLYDPEREVRQIVYAWQRDQEFDPATLEPAPVRNGPAGQAIKRNQVVICNDYQTALGNLPRTARIGFEEDARVPHSMLVVPMTVMERVVGTIESQSYEVGAFDSEHATMMRMAANLAASAIENVRLIEQERERAEQLRQAQRMEAIGRLAGGVAHDFNNLLTAISGYSDLTLRRLNPNDPLRDNLDEVKKAAVRATGLTRQLLAFSRKQVLKPRVLNLNNTIAEMNKMLPRLIGEHIEMITTLSADLGQVRADPGQIEQVIVNLAVNARDAMPLGGKLIFKTENLIMDEELVSRYESVQAGPHVLLTVSDTGHGMDAETLKHIFEPFFTTKELGKGTGLGLSTVYGIVKQSGGYISVESGAGQGTTFKIYLPRVAEEAETIKAAPSPTKLVPGNETILLVEDEELVRGMATATLEMSGYDVLTAASGGEALLLCEKHKDKIDLLLTDVVMPHISGREVANRLLELRPDMRVLYMSGYTEDAITQHGVLDEGTAFIEKPFTPDALAGKIRELLDSPR